MTKIGRAVVAVAAATLVVSLSIALPAAAGASAARPTVPAAQQAPGQPDLGPNVYVFDPSMPVSQIQSTVDAIATLQLSNQFGEQRYALLFKPGTYGTSEDPLNFQVGYYTDVAGLGATPNDVVINGSIDVYNQCDSGGTCIALNNFWRSLSNLTINVTTPDAGCKTGEFWAVSQAAPMRRVNVNGNTTLMDYCSNPSFASGGFIADSNFAGGSIVNGSQQQFFVRNTAVDGWSNGVWNQVFAGDPGAPAQCYPGVTNGCGPYTTLATTPASREKPYLYVDSRRQVAGVRPGRPDELVGHQLVVRSRRGRSIPLSHFLVAKPSDSVQVDQSGAGARAESAADPGRLRDRPQHQGQPARHRRARPRAGHAHRRARRDTALASANVAGVDIAGLVVDAGPVKSPVLVRIGSRHGRQPAGSAARPDRPAGRVLPHRRAARRPRQGEPGSQQ